MNAVVPLFCIPLDDLRDVLDVSCVTTRLSNMNVVDPLGFAVQRLRNVLDVSVLFCFAVPSSTL